MPAARGAQLITVDPVIYGRHFDDSVPARDVGAKLLKRNLSDLAAMGGRPSGAGRTIVLASFLLGGPSGSGVATTVTLGSVAYPMLVKAGYGKDAAGGLLAAGGLGAAQQPIIG